MIPGLILGSEDPLEKAMATHSSSLAWGIPRTEEPGRIQSMESQRVGHSSETNTMHIKVSVVDEKFKKKGKLFLWEFVFLIRNVI